MLARQRVFDFGPSDHFTALHGGHRCPVAVATKSVEGEFQQRLYPHADARQMLVNLAGVDDLNTYLSQSGFAQPGGRRTVGQVRALTSWWVDLDSYKLPAFAGLDAEQMLNAAIERFPWLPTPTLLVSSGRGSYLVWAFNAPVGVERLAQWQEVEDRLVWMLEPFGADAAARDAARILRVVGSFHLVAGDRVRASRIGDAVSFERMRQLVLQHAPVKSPRFKEAAELRVLEGAGVVRPRTGKGLSAYRLAQDRMNDYRLLAELRGGRLTDYRHRMLYAFGQASSWFCGSVEQLRSELDEFADRYFADARRYRAQRVQSVIDRFVDDGAGRVVRLASTRDEGRYRFSNRYIISLLSIDRAEQMRLRTIISTAEKRRRETEKRRAAGMMSREQYRDRSAQRRTEALRMRSEGLSVAAIAEHLGVSRMWAYKLLSG